MSPAREWVGNLIRMIREATTMKQTGYGVLRFACAALGAIVLLSGCESKDSYEEKRALIQEVQTLMQEVQSVKEDRDALETDGDRLANENSALVAVIEIEKVITQVAGESPGKTIVATKSSIRVVQKIRPDDRVQKKLALEHQSALDSEYHLNFHQAIGDHGSRRLNDEFGKYCKTIKKKEADCP